MSRVLMLLENNPYPSDTRVRNEAQSLYAAGYPVTVIAPADDGQAPHEWVDGVEVERFRLKRRRPSRLAFVLEYLAANLQLHWRTIRRLRRFEVLHLHNPPDTLFPVAFLARALRRCVVFDQHDLAPELFVERFGGGPALKILRWCERLTYRAADAVVVTNESFRSIALERGRVNADTLFIVRNAPRLELFAGIPPARLGPLADPRLVFVGSMGPQDGVDDLPDLLLHLREEFGLVGAHLTVVGDGERLEPVRARCAQAALGAAVTFTGRLGPDGVARALAEADICLEPARHGEHNDRCSMVKVYEYMAAGRPIVSYPLREVGLLGGEDIAYARPNDVRALAAEVARLAADADDRRRRAAALRHRSVRFSWDAESKQLLSAYESLRECGS